MNRKTAVMLLTAGLLCGCTPSERQRMPDDAEKAVQCQTMHPATAPQSAADAERDASAEEFAEKQTSEFRHNPEAVRVLLCHDLLCRRCEYDRQAAGRHTAYGALIGGKAVCDGYAAAFELLLQKAGIPVMTVRGFAGRQENASEAHAWNLVQLDGNWYHVDCTWDDCDASGCACTHDYFLCSDAVMRDTHCWDETEYPPAAGGGYRYETIVQEMFAEYYDSFG